MGLVRGLVLVAALLVALVAAPGPGEAADNSCVGYADPTSGNAVVFAPSGQSVAFRIGDGQTFGGPATRHWAARGRVVILYRTREATIIVQTVVATGRVQASFVHRAPAATPGAAPVRRSYVLSVENAPPVRMACPGESLPPRTPSPSATATPSPTERPAPTPTRTATPTAAPSPRRTATEVPPSARTATAIPSPTRRHTDTPTGTATAPPTVTSTWAPSPTSTATRAATASPTRSPTPTATPTREATREPTPSPSATPTPTVHPTASATASPSTTPTTTSRSLRLGELRLSATFNSIGVELLYAGDTDGNAQVGLEFRPAGGQWRAGLPLWQVAANDGPGPAFYGSALLLDPGTRYEVRATATDPDGVDGEAVATGEIVTRREDVPAAASLTPTRYVRATGDDGADGTTEATAWRTLGRVATAPSGAVIQVGPGYYAAPGGVGLGSGVTLVAQYPAVDDAGAPANVGRRSVVDSGIVSGPAGAIDPGVAPAPWQRITVDGPGKGGAPAGAQYAVWRWAGVPAGPGWLGFAASREAAPKRLANWALKGADLQTPGGWVEKVFTNKSYNYGWAAFANGSGGYDLYARLPGDLDPNTLYLTAGTSTGVQIGGPGARVSGFELRPFSSGVDFTPGATRGVVDHNLIEVGFAGVRFDGDKDALPNRYGSDHVVERNLIVDSSLWTDDHVNNPAIPWCFVKCQIYNADGTLYSPGRLGEGNETAGVFDRGGARRIVFRRNTIDGPFNGITAYGAGFDRYATQEQDVHDNLIRHISDDALEPEQNGINWRMWGNRIEQTSTVLSTGPVAYGPLYLFRNEAWRTGKDGVGRDDAGEASVGAVFFKYSGESNPPARVFVLHNTLWTDSTWSGPADKQRGVDGSGQYAGGGSSTERFYMRNNIIRATRYAFQAGIWDEEANSFSTSDTTRGLAAYSARFTTNVAGYRAAAQRATGRATTTNAGWDPATGAGSFVAPPDAWLTDPAHGDLSLAPGSNFVDAGVPVPNLSDRPGVDYDGAAPDLGAREHRASG